MKESFDYNLIKYLVAIIDTNSMVSAADQLGVTPSVVSYSVNKLRDYYKDPLFVRIKNGVQPTMLARNLYNMFKPIDESIENGLIGRKPGDRRALDIKRVMRIRANPLMEYFISINMLRSPQISSGILLEFYSTKYSSLEDRISRIRRKDIDIDFGLYIAGDNNVVAIPLFPFSLVAVCRKGHPRLTDRVTLDQWLQEEHVAWAIIDDYINEIGLFEDFNKKLNNKVMLRCSSLINMVLLVAASDVLTIIPDKFISRLSDVIEIKRLHADFLPINNLYLYAYVHKTQAKDPVLLSFLEEIKSAF